MGQVSSSVASRLNGDYRTYVFARTGCYHIVEANPARDLTVFGIKIRKKQGPPGGGFYSKTLRDDCWEAEDHWHCVRKFIEGNGERLKIDPENTVGWYHDWFGMFPMIGLSEMGIHGALTYHMSHARGQSAIANDGRLYCEKTGADHIKDSPSMATAVSGCQKEVVGQAYGLDDENLVVIPNGVDVDVFRPFGQGEGSDVLDKYGLKKPYILFCGRPVGEKRPEKVLEAMEYVLEAKPDMNVVFMFLGRPEHCMNQYFWDVFDHQLGYDKSKVMFPRIPGVGDSLGFYIPDDERAAIYANAEVEVNPSDPAIASEAFGLVSPEAQACGTPVVVGRGTGLVETMRDGITGKMIDPQNPAAIAEAVLHCMDTPAMGREGRRLMEDVYSWDLLSKKYAELFHSIQ